MSVIAMIPARAGSRGLPGKNVAPLHGNPMIAWTIKAAMTCPAIDETWVNTNCKQCMDIASVLGAMVYERDTMLAKSDSSMLDVVVDFAHSRTCPCDTIVLLYPTYPLRTHKDISAMMEAFNANGGKRPLIGVTEPKTHPFLCVSEESKSTVLGHGMFQRQQFPPYYEFTHQACVIPVSKLSEMDDCMMHEKGMLYQIKGPIVDVDLPEDLELAEFYMGRR